MKRTHRNTEKEIPRRNESRLIERREFYVQYARKTAHRRLSMKEDILC